MNEIVGMMPHSDDLFKRQMKKWEFWDAAAYSQATQNSSYPNESEYLNSPTNNRGFSQSNKHLVKVDNIPDARLKVTFPYDREAMASDMHNNKEPSDKSFIQQRIERLYGPSALGVGFRARRALLELQQDHGLVNDVDLSVGGRPREASSPDIPSVFRHLRPEFRYQLPIKAKSGIQFDSETKRFHEKAHHKNETGQFVQKIASLDINCRKAENERGRIIPIQLENGHSSEVASLDSNESADPFLNGTVNTKQNERTLLLSATKDIDSHAQEERLLQPAKTKQTPDLNSNFNLSKDAQGCSASQPKQNQIKDGNYFLKVVDEEKSVLLKQASLIEQDLADHSDLMSEDMKGKLFSTVGKVNLLISQKLKQFVGLCHKNINCSPSEEFPTTNEDLAGFWDMVVIQVDSLKKEMQEIQKIKANEWKEVIVSKPTSTQSKGKSTVKKLAKPAAKSPKDEARKKAMEERRQAMRDAMNAKRKEASKKGKDDQVEIFIADK